MIDAKILKIDPALVALCDYEHQIQVAVLNDEPTVDQIPLEGMNLYSLQTCVIFIDRVPFILTIRLSFFTS